MLDLLERGFYFATDDSGGGDEAESDEDTKNPSESEDKGDADDSAEDKKEIEKDEFSDLSEDDLKAQLFKTRDALKKANNESKDRRLKLKKFEEDDSKRKKKEMTEIDRLKTEKEESDNKTGLLEKRVRAMHLRSTVITTASDLNFREPQDAYDLADLEEAIAIVNDSDNIFESEKPSAELVKMVKKSLSDLVKSKPYLIQKTTKPNIDARKQSDGKKPEAEKLKRRFGIN